MYQLILAIVFLLLPLISALPLPIEVNDVSDVKKAEQLYWRGYNRPTRSMTTRRGKRDPFPLPFALLHQEGKAEVEQLYWRGNQGYKHPAIAIAPQRNTRQPISKPEIVTLTRESIPAPPIIPIAVPIPISKPAPKPKPTKPKPNKPAAKKPEIPDKPPARIHGAQGLPNKGW